jgi:hypothetical protein
MKVDAQKILTATCKSKTQRTVFLHNPPPLQRVWSTSSPISVCPQNKNFWFVTSKDLILLPHHSENVCLLSPIPPTKKESKHTLISSGCGGHSPTANLNPMQNNTASKQEVGGLFTTKKAMQLVDCLLLKSKAQSR